MMKIYFNNKKIDISVEKLGFFGRISGLMFRSKETKNLLFDFEKDVSYKFHSMFCFFPFLILWLDKKNKVIDFKLVKPFILQIPSPKSFVKVVEIPFNNDNIEILQFFVGKERFK